jgi:hypothetical protein
MLISNSRALFPHVCSTPIPQTDPSRALTLDALDDFDSTLISYPTSRVGHNRRCLKAHTSVTFSSQSIKIQSERHLSLFFSYIFFSTLFLLTFFFFHAFVLF